MSVSVTTTLPILPLGRVPMPKLLRFEDRPAARIDRQAIDVQGWLGRVAGDTIASATVAISPAGDGGLVSSSVQISGSIISFGLAGGIEEQDYEVTITYVTAQGRQNQVGVRQYVATLDELTDAIVVSCSSGDVPTSVLYLTGPGGLELTGPGGALLIVG